MSTLAYSIPDAAAAAALGLTKIKEAIRSGELPSRLHGKRRIILASDLQAWLENLPAEPSTRPAQGADGRFAGGQS
jgi:hypothetical protein